jgi:hypothetical protein
MIQQTRTKMHKRIGSIAISNMEPKYQEVNGKFVKLCLNGCGKPIPSGNRKYCSLECSNEFFAKHNQRGLAELVFKREKGTCQKCGWKNPSAPREPKYPGWVNGGIEAHKRAVREYHKVLKEHEKLMTAWRKLEKRVFVADHIIPIALGGPGLPLQFPTPRLRCSQTCGRCCPETSTATWNCPSARDA